jgi:hypothetical protein
MGCQMAKVHDEILTHGRQGALALAVTPSDQQAVRLAASFLALEITETGFTHPGLCLTVLPYRALPPEAEWRRTSDHVTLSVQPLRDSSGQFRGVPYGSKARLILLYLQSEAIRTGSPVIELGASMHDWLKRLGISSGGKTYSLVIDQADRIASCALTFTYRGPTGQTHWQDSIVRGTFDPRVRGAERLVKLSETFFDALRRHPTPVNIAAVQTLNDRCSALDIYLWLCYRLHSLKSSIFISWTALFKQFGAATTHLHHFKPRFQRDIKAAESVYPEARLDVVAKGVILHPSPPPAFSSHSSRPLLIA